MMKLLLAAPLSFALLLAGPALAATYRESGVVPANTEFLALGGPDVVPGLQFYPGETYYFAYQFSRPAVTVSADYAYGLDYTCYEGGFGYQEIFYCGSNDFAGSAFAAANSVKGHFSWTTPQGFDSTTVEPDGFTYGTTGDVVYLFGYYAVDFGGTGDVAYSIFASDVPEPASWSLMLAGFGLVGAALRSGRRRYHSVTKLC
jgi:hypothetical protein